MIGPVVAMCAGLGVYFLYTSSVIGEGRRRSPARAARSAIDASGARARTWLVQAGLEGIRPRDLVVATALVFAGAAAVATMLFGGAIPALAAGALAASAPIQLARQRRHARRQAGQEAWPRLIEEIRLRTSSVGRSIPQALFEAGRSAPEALRPAFDAAQREWSISTDFRRTVTVLEAHVGDVSADMTCETLLVAHELGGADLDRRLADLAADRRADLDHRKDARAKQAGVRFARLFVLLVPLGMALAGLSVGEGRRAYTSFRGQLAVVAALGIVGGCWVWAGRLMRLPEEPRVFHLR